jgi:hypothetical protein
MFMSKMHLRLGCYTAETDLVNFWSTIDRNLPSIMRDEEVGQQGRLARTLSVFQRLS